MIAVVGSLNLDLVAPVPHHPATGETVLGGELARHPGGKGANQAVAAARLGGEVAMVGRIGDDDAGELLLASLRGAGVDVSRVQRTGQVPTGQALIAIDPQGENTIVVCPGANARLGAAECEAAGGLLASASVLLLQQEVPAAANQAAARLAGGTVLYNPAPATPAATIPPGVEVLTPNRGELATLTGRPIPRTITEAAAAARDLTSAAAVVVTLGSEGALVIEGRTHRHIPAFGVRALDTTAAGDAFCGALAVALSEGISLVGAVRWACAAAALSTTRPGAQPSLPHRPEVQRLLARA